MPSPLRTNPPHLKAELTFNTEFTLYLDDKTDPPYKYPIGGRLEGILPHLGKLQVGLEKDFTAGSYWVSPPPTIVIVDKKPVSLSYAAVAHFIAANGDELIANVTGLIYPPEWGPGPGGLNWIGTYEYQHGTGRFAKAEGNGTTTGVYTSPLTILMKTEGTILNVGQSKKN
jgi:hypothetical protein